MSKKTEIRIPWGSGIVGMVAASGKSVNISDCYAEEKFNPVSHQFDDFLQKIMTSITQHENLRPNIPKYSPDEIPPF